MLLLVPRTYFRWESCWNFPAGASELIPFVACLDRFCYSRSAEIPSWGCLLVFPCWGFTLIVRLQGTQFSLVGGLLFFSFLGELHYSFPTYSKNSRLTSVKLSAHRLAESKTIPRQFRPLQVPSYFGVDGCDAFADTAAFGFWQFQCHCTFAPVADAWS